MSYTNYISATEPNVRGEAGLVHWRPDARHPVTACGFDYTGIYATTHPIYTGGAFSCPDCEAAWRASAAS